MFSLFVKAFMVSPVVVAIVGAIITGEQMYGLYVVFLVYTVPIGFVLLLVNKWFRKKVNIQETNLDKENAVIKGISITTVVVAVIVTSCFLFLLSIVFSQIS